MKLLGYAVVNKSKDTLEKAISKYGEEYQITMLIEEASECIKEMCKLERGVGDLSELCKEVSDLFITISSISIINGYCFSAWRPLEKDDYISYKDCVSSINILVSSVIENEPEELVIDSIVGVWYRLEKFLNQSTQFTEDLFYTAFKDKLQKLERYC